MAREFKKATQHETFVSIDHHGKRVETTRTTEGKATIIKTETLEVCLFFQNFGEGDDISSITYQYGEDEPWMVYGDDSAGHIDITFEE